MPFSYHDTTDQKGKTLDTYEEKAKSQEEHILRFFRENPGVHFSPFDILTNCYVGIVNPPPPITSVRRAITNIEHQFQGLDYGVRKSDKKKKGKYGRDNYMWYYVPQRIQKDLFL